MTLSLLDSEKIFYERFWNLLNDRQLMSVFEKYGPAAFRRSSVLEGFEQFIKAHNFSGRVVVEIGTLKGLTALILARYFKRVITIDVVEDPQKYEIAEALGVTNITFVKVLGNDEKEYGIQALDFDAAYLDGDHARDTPEDFALVKRCGQVLMHEFWPAQPAVVSLVESLDNVVTSGKFALWRAP